MSFDLYIFYLSYRIIASLLLLLTYPPLGSALSPLSASVLLLCHLLQHVEGKDVHVVAIAPDNAKTREDVKFEGLY